MVRVERWSPVQWLGDAQKTRWRASAESRFGGTHLARGPCVGEPASQTYVARQAGENKYPARVYGSYRREVSVVQCFLLHENICTLIELQPR